jgi:hypothetical protein
MDRSYVISKFTLRWLNLLLFFSCLVVPYFCFAQSPYDKEEAQIPQKPSTPPALMQRIAPNIPHCERYFVYQGKNMECDSNSGQDADRFRTIMEDVPAAIAELDVYQSNRQKMRIAAYSGTLGVLAMISGFFVIGRPDPPFDPLSGTPSAGGYTMIGGIGLFVSSIIYGLTVSRTNEAHIGNAVQFFNAAHPDRPIELRFSTGINF